MTDQAGQFILENLRMPVAEPVHTFAEKLRSQHTNVCAVFTYGSALRDSDFSETLIDYYLVVDRPQDLHPKWLLQVLGNAIPPNVFYSEMALDGKILRSKYSLITRQSFAKLMVASNPYLWARFAQPTRLLWTKDIATEIEMVAAISSAICTAKAHGHYLSVENSWVALFQNTYRTELRPEAANRAQDIVLANQSYYDRLDALFSQIVPQPSSWMAKRVLGKLWSLARLGKNAFTFAGGADYAAWKIARHSGVKIEVTDWQRRHPFLAGLLILPKLLSRKGLK